MIKLLVLQIVLLKILVKINYDLILNILILKVLVQILQILDAWLEFYMIISLIVITSVNIKLQFL